MEAIKDSLKSLDNGGNVSKGRIVSEIDTLLRATLFVPVEVNNEKPWGAYFRMDNNDAPRFIDEFFHGLSIEEAQLGISGAELSPKILVVAPGQRLSWQYHDRRAERWAFITKGSYNKSINDEPGETISADNGDIVQFGRGERHRLIGALETYTIVAEIWQHTERGNPSNEDDIVRLADDYQR